MLPDMRDEPSFEEVLGGMEDAMGEDSQGSGDGMNSGTGDMTGTGQAGGGSGAGGGDYGNPQGTGTPGGYGGASGSGGPLTPAEQVAVLDAQLEKGTGEFDGMILEEQANQRRAAREGSSSAPEENTETGGGTGTGYGSGGPYESGTADGGGYSTGGGMGGASSGGGSMPKNTAKYPPPADIPDGDDDDVVARQLREAAMREPDPAVREKLWDEYRKYKGIDK
jgi:hypothetical protein